MCSTYRMPIARPKQFPSGFLVAALLAASGLLWAVMFFGPLPHLERPASGLTPLDIRPSGYNYAVDLQLPRHCVLSFATRNVLNRPLLKLSSYEATGILRGTLPRSCPECRWRSC
jgi:hypothetical protein